MNFGRVPNGESLFRHTVFPVAFKSKGKRFAYEKVIRLTYLPDTREILASVAWGRYAPTVQHVHAYGCRMAARTNIRNKLAATSKNQHVYCGAYRFDGTAVRALAQDAMLEEVRSANVVHRIENGEIAHADLVIILGAGDYDLEATKTAIVDRLWNACSGPLRHVCDCDKSLEEHPSERLESAPKGPYVDTRSPLRQRWQVIRFCVSRWLLRQFNSGLGD